MMSEDHCRLVYWAVGAALILFLVLISVVLRLMIQYYVPILKFTTAVLLIVLVPYLFGQFVLRLSNSIGDWIGK